MRELDDSDRLQPKPIGKDAFPVFYIEPLAENIAALGFDLASDPKRLNAIQASITRDVVVATAPIRLVQERSQQLGILLIQHVPGSARTPSSASSSCCLMRCRRARPVRFSKRSSLGAGSTIGLFVVR